MCKLKIEKEKIKKLRNLSSSKKKVRFEQKFQNWANIGSILVQSSL